VSTGGERLRCAPVPRYIAYRKDLKSRARSLRTNATPAERKLWYEFLSGLPQKFSRQKPLGRYVADFYCSRLRLVIEVDGDSHFTEGAERYDGLRTADLQARGLRVLRFTNAEVMQDFEAVCAVVLNVLGDACPPDKGGVSRRRTGG
jgi:very-short-patch-repair endonuclease